MSTQTTSPLAPKPFTIDIPQAEIDRLLERLDTVRWPNAVDESSSEKGLAISTVRDLVERWRGSFDWRTAEAELNRMTHQMAKVRGLDIHCVHERADDSKVPVLMLHGWPDSFFRFSKVAPMLGAAGHSVIIPSLPGYAFSEQPTSALSVESVAEIVHDLALQLGHERYAIHGGDWGSAIAEQVAIAQPESVVALHLTDVPFHHQFALDRSGVSDAERAFLDSSLAWAEEATYFSVQSKEATLLAYGLSDSPVGLAAWLLDKYRWSTQPGLDLDDVLTQVCLYWFTNTIWSSMRLYSEGFGSWEDDHGGDTGGPEAASWAEESWAPKAAVAPTAFAVFPDDIAVPPREYAERFFDVKRFSVMPRGGHFAALEVPELLAADLIAFLADSSTPRG